MREPKYRVVLSGDVLPEQSRARVLDALAELFHTTRENVEPLLRGRRTPLAKSYAHAEAQEICAAIRNAGAQCAVEEIAAQEVAHAREEKVTLDENAEQPTRENVAQEETVQEKSAQQDSARAESAQQESSQQDSAQQKSTRQKSTRRARESFPLETELMRFVEVNTAYYRRQFARFYKFDDAGNARFGFALSWHWPAFISFFFWAAYRKMYLPSLFYLGATMALLLTAQPNWVYFLWMIFWPLSANYFYFRHAHRRVRMRMPGGGTSPLSAIAGAVLTVVVSMMISPHISERMQQKLHDEYHALPPEAKTNFVMRSTAVMALREFPRGEALDEQQVLDFYRAFLEEKRVRDGWDNELEVRRAPGGGYALVSAGRDGYFDTEDDLRRRIEWFSQ